ncbi:hypothetical protein Tco_0027396 [Tanacetum coccineum]
MVYLFVLHYVQWCWCLWGCPLFLALLPQPCYHEVALLLGMDYDGSAPAIRSVMAFNTVSILLVISLFLRIVAEGIVQYRIAGLEPVSPRLFCLGLKVYHLPPVSSISHEEVASEQDELPSSVGLDSQARSDGGQMYSGHLEAKRLP